MHEFTPWPKTARLFRDIVVTEKIDGTNAAIHISAVDSYATGFLDYPSESYSLVVDGTRYVVTTQSRNRLITPGKTTDNYGFAGWVYENAAALVRILGAGLHYGEWWGHGIQRGYGLDARRFSLFNTERYADTLAMIGGVHVAPVPALYQGTFSEGEILSALHLLRRFGSFAAPGWATPEGICVYHSAMQAVTKVTLDNYDAGKWEGA